MATATAPKSILKKPRYPIAKSSTADRDREVALYHANLIQERKDIEFTILLSTETLIDFPHSALPYSSSNPSLSDARTFKTLLRPFQPSDYDALIVERNINNHCGYALCSKPRAKDGKAGKYRIIGKTGKAKDFRVVEKEELEKWCSEECARRALYVRVQLSDSPAWEREAASGAEIKLLNEPKPEGDQVMKGIEGLDLSTCARPGEAQDKKQDAANLALDRVDKGHAASNDLVSAKVQEKGVQRPAEAPTLDLKDLRDRLDTMHLTLEGHTTSFGSQRQRRYHEEMDGENEDADADWNL